MDRSKILTNVRPEGIRNQSLEEARGNPTGDSCVQQPSGLAAPENKACEELCTKLASLKEQENTFEEVAKEL